MKTKYGRGLLLASLLFPAMLGFDSPAPNLAYGDGSRMWIEGTSSVRSFRCEAGRIDGAVVSRPVGTIADLQEAVDGVDLAVPVAMLDCGNGTMNGHMFKALRVSNHPFITYTHESHEVVIQESGKGTIQMNGKLTIAGATNPIALSALATELPGGTIRVEGSKQLKMTEFGVKPPSLMLGTMKVHDPVTVRFDLLLQP